MDVKIHERIQKEVILAPRADKRSPSGAPPPDPREGRDASRPAWAFPPAVGQPCDGDTLIEYAKGIEDVDDSKDPFVQNPPGFYKTGFIGEVKRWRALPRQPVLRFKAHSNEAVSLLNFSTPDGIGFTYAKPGAASCEYNVKLGGHHSQKDPFNPPKGDDYAVSMRCNAGLSLFGHGVSLGGNLTSTGSMTAQVSGQLANVSYALVAQIVDEERQAFVVSANTILRAATVSARSDLGRNVTFSYAQSTHEDAVWGVKFKHDVETAWPTTQVFGRFSIARSHEYESDPGIHPEAYLTVIAKSTGKRSFMPKLGADATPMDHLVSHFGGISAFYYHETRPCPAPGTPRDILDYRTMYAVGLTLGRRKEGWKSRVAAGLGLRNVYFGYRARIDSNASVRSRIVTSIGGTKILLMGHVNVLRNIYRMGIRFKFNT